MAFTAVVTWSYCYLFSFSCLPLANRLNVFSKLVIRYVCDCAACIWRASRGCTTALPSRFDAPQTCPSIIARVTRPPGAPALARARPPRQRTPRTQYTPDPSSSVTWSRGSSPTVGWYWASVPSRAWNQSVYHRSTLTLVAVCLHYWSTTTISTSTAHLTNLPSIYPHTGSCMSSLLTLTSVPSRVWQS